MCGKLLQNNFNNGALFHGSWLRTLDEAFKSKQPKHSSPTVNVLRVSPSETSSVMFRKMCIEMRIDLNLALAMCLFIDMVFWNLLRFNCYENARKLLARSNSVVYLVPHNDSVDLLVFLTDLFALMQTIINSN